MHPCSTRNNHGFGNTICSFFILFFIAFPSIFRRPLLIEIVNSAGLILSQNMTITHSISFTPKENIIFSQNFISHMDNFNYLICDQRINDYFTNIKEWGTCQPRIQNQFFSFFNSTYFVFRDVYSNTHGSWAVNRTSIVSLGQENYGFVFCPGWFEIENSTINYIFDDVIQIAHAHTRDHYGHFLADCLIPTLLLPEETICNSYVLGASFPSFINDGFQAIGIPQNHIINASYNQWFYTKKLHTFAGKRPSLSFFGYSCLNFNKLIRNKLRLNEISSNKYYLQNRNYGNFRHIGNFNELHIMVKKYFPYIRWLILPDLLGSFEHTAKVWATARFVCTITGSNAIKAIFMKTESVVVLAMANTFEKSTLGIISSSRHYVILFPVPGMEQFSKDKNKAWTINITIAIEAIKKGLEIDKKQS